MILVGIGYSQEKDSALAGRLAAEQAIQHSGDPVITFLFCTDNYEQKDVFHAIKRIIGNSKLVGACASGIIVGSNVFTKGVGVCTIGGSEIEAATCLRENITCCSYESGEEAGRKLLESGLDCGTVFVFPDGLAANISVLLRGLYNALGPDYNYIGGGTGDNLRFSKSFQFTEHGVSSDALAVAVVKGIDFHVSIGHGWEPVGQPLMVTRAKGKRVYELDGLPAFDRYASCLGSIDKNEFYYYSMRHPLGIPSIGADFLIRDPLKVIDDHSIIFVTEVPQNTVATIMKGDVDSLLSAAENVSREAFKTCTSPKLVLLFDCVSRYLLMGKDFDREIAAVARNAGAGVPMIGMLSFGEVASSSGTPLFYNKTILVTAG